MKEQIKKIVEEIYKRDNFLNKCQVTLHINLVTLIASYENMLFDEKAFRKINNFIDSREIKNYNISFRIENGTDSSLNYSNDWKSVDFVFYGGKPEKDDFDAGFDSDYEKFGLFNFRYLGTGGDINTAEIAELSVVEHDDKDPYRKRFNKYQYDDISKLVDILLEFEKLIDKQQQEKILIYDKIKKLQ